MSTLFSYFKKTPKNEKKIKLPAAKENGKISEKTKEMEIGDLVWAKVAGFPFWPAMVCKDPQSQKCRTKKRDVSKIHVQFFGQPPTHDWAVDIDVTRLSYQKPGDKNEELNLAYKEAIEAEKLNADERISKYYACAVTDDEEEENDASMNESEDNNNQQTKKRPLLNGDLKARKRIKMSIPSDDEDDTDEDESYKPGGDVSAMSEDEEYQSDNIESEEEEEISSGEEEEIPKKKSKKDTPKAKTPKSSKTVKKEISGKNKSFLSDSSFSSTPNKSILNNSVSKAQSTLAKFSSPSIASPSPTSDSNSCMEQNFTHLKLKFLHDGYRKDKLGKLHTNPDYDSRTLYVPDSYINSKEVTPGMKQWWTLKRDLHDTVIFFKVGKFYELYHMDAAVGIKELGLIYMKGKFAHCGFPEIAFSRYSEVLVQRGYKVARIEQTETPQAMSARNGGKVVRREVCAVISKGTRTFSFMEGQADGDASNYLLAFVEKPCNDVSLGGSEFGVCFLDTSIGKFHLGQFKDDRQCSRFLTMISQYPPAQVLYERHGLSPKLQHILNHELLAAIKDPLTQGSEFWDSSKTMKHLQEMAYFTENNENKENKETASNEIPDIIKGMLSHGDTLGLDVSNDYQYAISSLGACTWYLKKCCLDVELLSMSKFEEYVPTDNLNQRKVLRNDMPQYMILDGVTLSNLDIVINMDGTTEGTLLELLDHCATPFGKRYFKQWLCSPSCSKKAIENRLNAVEDLMRLECDVVEARNIMRTMPDLERILRRIHSLGSLRRSKDHPDSRAIFYNEETYSKKKISDLLSAIDGFTKTMQIIQILQEKLSEFKSSWLKSLLLKDAGNGGGEFPDLNVTLKFFTYAFDHKKAKETGTIHPKKGVLLEYDQALQDMMTIKDKLDQYLKQQRKRLGCSSIVYWGTGKNRYQLEIPESALRSSTPNEYHLKSQKKGYKRYTTVSIDQLNESLAEAEERRDSALKDTMRNIFNKFDSEGNLWSKAVRCLATIDCLMSLAYYSNNIDGVSCRPEIIDIVDADGNDVQPFFELLDCRHPCISQQSLNGGDLIPNDIVLGKPTDSSSSGEAPCCVLITGPNMGGKSTLMRQAGVLLIMAQLGCYVPAQVCRFTPVDRVFTRLGARDRILHGESTFFVELSETSTIFQHATKHSLVLLDELGRGTATYDGTAIASAVVHDLANRIQCRTLFSTHYHALVGQFLKDKNISLGHMACMVEKDEEDDDDPTNETITFLYKFTTGACPKSYGFNAAKLAGLPLSIIKSAHEKAKAFEDSSKNVQFLRSITTTNSSPDQLLMKMKLLHT